MKKIIVLIFCVYCNSIIAQVPTIKERYKKNNNKNFAINYKKLRELKKDTSGCIIKLLEGLKTNYAITSNDSIVARIEDFETQIKNLITSNNTKQSSDNTFDNVDSEKKVKAIETKISQLKIIEAGLTFSYNDVDKKFEFTVNSGFSEKKLLNTLNDLGFELECYTIKDAGCGFLQNDDKQVDPLVVRLLPKAAIRYFEDVMEHAKDTLAKREEVLAKAKDINEIIKLSDAIKAERKTLKFANRSLLCAKKKHFWGDAFFPTSDATKGQAFEAIYDKDNEQSFYFGNEATLLFNTNGSGATIETELASAYLGAFKITFGSLLSNQGTIETNNDSTEDGNMQNTENAEENTMENTEQSMEEADETAAFQRLISKGGNAYLEIVYPIHYYQSKRAFTYLSLGARAGVELQEFNTDVNTSNGVGSLFGNFYYSLSTDDNTFNFFTNINYGLYAGGNDFYQRLSVEDEKPFGFGNITAGVTIQSSVRFAVTFATLSSDRDLRSNSIMLSTQILSNIFNK
jgi:hypothetical protein